MDQRNIAIENITLYIYIITLTVNSKDMDPLFPFSRLADLGKVISPRRDREKARRKASKVERDVSEFLRSR